MSVFKIEQNTCIRPLMKARAKIASNHLYLTFRESKNYTSVLKSYLKRLFRENENAKSDFTTDNKSLVLRSVSPRHLELLRQSHLPLISNVHLILDRVTDKAASRDRSSWTSIWLTWHATEKCKTNTCWSGPTNSLPFCISLSLSLSTTDLFILEK